MWTKRPQRWAGRASVYTFSLECTTWGNPMRKKTPSKATPAKRVEEPKVAMSYRLSRDKIARAQSVLGTSTATATIEQALDLVVFRRELVDGVNKAFGIPVRD